MTPRKQLHFALTEKEADALLALVNGIEEARILSVRHPVSSAANKLDEQMANQKRTWEVCPECGGSGWKEEQ